MTRPIHTGRFRWRLTIAFILVAGISSGAVAVGSFLLVRNHRQQVFVDRSLDDSRLALSLADNTLSSTSSTRDVRQLLGRFDRRRFDALAVVGSRVLSTGTSVGLVDLQAAGVPEPSEDITSTEVVLSDEPFLVASASVSNPDVAFYLLFSERPLTTGLSSLMGVLLGTWLVVTAIAALVGLGLARRTLQPVAKASRAARSLAEGLLDTRLPVEREDEFGAWAVSFNEMADALQEKINALSEAHERERRFTSDVSHELRTPLAALVSAASLAKQHLKELSPESRWVVERMLEDVARLRALVEELMEISRLDSGRESIQIETLDLARLASVIAKTRGWDSLVSVTEESSSIISTDRRRVERVITNLISNALDHGRTNVRVRVWANGDGARVEVADDGPGIPRELLPHIFERFFKADPARSGGTGLGLSIARENARMLGGDIKVISDLGLGARFTLSLPDQAPMPHSLVEHEDSRRDAVTNGVDAPLDWKHTRAGSS